MRSEQILFPRRATWSFESVFAARRLLTECFRRVPKHFDLDLPRRNCGSHQIAHAHQVVGRRRQGEDPQRSTSLRAVLVHTLGYLVVTGFVAWMVYENLGLALLRKAWLNLDLIWAGALVVTGAFVLAV